MANKGGEVPPARGGLDRLALAVRDVLRHRNVGSYGCVTGVFLDGGNPDRANGRLASQERDAFLIGDKGLFIVSPKAPAEFENPSERELERTLEALISNDPTWALGRLIVAPQTRVREIRRSADVPAGFAVPEVGRAALGFAKVTFGDGAEPMHFWLDPKRQLAKPDELITGEGVAEHLDTFFNDMVPVWLER